MFESKMNTKLMKFVKYGLCFMNSPEDDPTVDELRTRLRVFFSSIGRFHKGAFLFPLYGSGDLSQSLCRASAVYGGTFLLSWPPSALSLSLPPKMHSISDRKGYLFRMNDSVFCRIERVINKENDLEKFFCCKEITLSNSSSSSLSNSDLGVTGQGEIFFTSSQMEHVEPVIGSIFETGGVSYEVETVNEDFVAKCVSVSSKDKFLHSSNKVFLSLSQLRHVKWFCGSLREGMKENRKMVLKAMDKKSFGGVISPKGDFKLKASRLVANGDYLMQYVKKTKVNCLRMIVISDGPLRGTSLEIRKDDDNDDDEDGDVEDDLPSDYLNCICHIPPSEGFGNENAIHFIQLDYLSQCVPKGLYLCYFWMAVDSGNRNEVGKGNTALKTCCDAMFCGSLKEVEMEEMGKERPVWLVRSFYEQRERMIDENALPGKTLAVQDLGSDIGFEKAVAVAKRIFKTMFPNDPFMPSPEQEVEQSRAEQAFEDLKQRLNIEKN